MRENLNINSVDIRDFLAEVQQALHCQRVRTSYGKLSSEHSFYAALTDGENVSPTIVTLEVANARGTTRVYLTEVRVPTSQEMTEIGVDPEAEVISLPKKDAKRAILETIGAARTTLRTAESLEQPRRGVLAYEGAPLAGEYELGPWRLSSAAESTTGSWTSEKILLCDRMVKGRDGHDLILRLMHQVNELASLLTVFWMRHHYKIRSEHRWTLEPHHEESGLRLENRLAQLGYSPEPLADEPMPPLAEPGPTAAVDRLNIDDWGSVVGDPFRPPDDAAELYELLQRADLGTEQRFLEASKAYHTAHTIWPETATGAIAYLVVAAESLVELPLAICSKCKQPQGVGRALRDLFFEELPCLKGREPEVTALLKRVYQIRSAHFHDAQFFGGELSEWHSYNVLMPDSIELREVHGKFMALVNGLLVAWLYRNVTGERWPRATGAFPAWREHKHFSMSVTLGSDPNS